MVKKEVTFKEKLKIWKALAKKKVRSFLLDLKNKMVALFFFIFAGFCMWLLVQILNQFYGFSVLEWIKDLPYVYGIFTHVFNEVKIRSDLGIFYLFMVSSFFLLPVPLEVIYINFIKEGVAFPKIGVIAVLGIAAGQIINYFAGRFFGFIFLPFIKKKTRKNVRDKLKSYGGYMITLVHLVPFPFQLFNFFCGVMKYRFWKWLLIMVTAHTVKHIAMYFIYVGFS